MTKRTKLKTTFMLAGAGGLALGLSEPAQQPCNRSTGRTNVLLGGPDTVSASRSEPALGRGSLMATAAHVNRGCRGAGSPLRGTPWFAPLPSPCREMHRRTRVTPLRG